jgi:hypothetical protein
VWFIIYNSNIYIIHNHFSKSKLLTESKFWQRFALFFHKEYGVAYIHGLRNIKINKKNKYYFHFKFLNLHLYFIIYKVKEKNDSSAHSEYFTIFLWFPLCQLIDHCHKYVLELIIIEPCNVERISLYTVSLCDYLKISPMTSHWYFKVYIWKFRRFRRIYFHIVSITTDMQAQSYSSG